MASARLPLWFLRTLIPATALTFIIGSASALHAQGALVDALIPYAKQDYEAARKLLDPLASQGDAIAQLTLGRMHLRGEGVPRNSFAAFEWHLKAAEQGNPDAQYALGVMHRDGVGTVADGQLALQWFKRAANRGAPPAFNAIGELYQVNRTCRRIFGPRSNGSAPAPRWTARRRCTTSACTTRWAAKARPMRSRPSSGSISRRALMPVTCMKKPFARAWRSQSA
jgi:hypothetical protein